MQFINFITIFLGCSSLISLPKICKWKTDSVESFYCLFENCISLVSIPDILNWNTDKSESLYDLFRGCISIISIPKMPKLCLMENNDDFLKRDYNKEINNMINDKFNFFD